jgi:S1-C subfamily serine protease
LIVKSIALLALCAALIAQSAFGAPLLNPSEKRTMELKPAGVMIKVNYKVGVRFRVGRDPYFREWTFEKRGTGFIYRPDGYIVTNGHVIADANRNDADAQRELRDAIINQIVQYVVSDIENLTSTKVTGNVDQILSQYSIVPAFTKNPDLTVTLPNNQVLKAEIKNYSGAMDPSGKGGKDVGIIKVDAANLPTVRLGDSDSLHIQEPMMVIGYPAAAELTGLTSVESSLIPTVTNGHISAIKPDFKGTRLIQSDAAINPGNSGGPAFNDAGEVIGIATLRPAEQTVGLYFFVPVNTAIEFVNSVGVKPQSGLFNKLWAAALDTYDSGKCQAAKGKLQSVLNIMPNLPDALSLMQASEKCAAEEGIVGRAMEGSTWMLYSAVGLVIVVTAVLLMRRKALPQAQAVVVGGAPRIGTRQETVPLPEPPRSSAEASYGSVQVMAGSLAGQKFKITKAGILVGTDPAKCQICVTEDAISHEHAWIVPVDNRVVVIDRGSTNGTFINSVDSPRVSKVGLQNGDRIYLGKKGSVVLTYFSA